MGAGEAMAFTVDHDALRATDKYTLPLDASWRGLHSTEAVLALPI